MGNKNYKIINNNDDDDVVDNKFLQYENIDAEVSTKEMHNLTLIYLMSEELSFLLVHSTTY